MSEPQVTGRFASIVCFSMSEWDTMPHNSRHLMREAAGRGYQVLYVDPIGLRRPTTQPKDLRKIVRRLRGLLKPLRSREPNIWTLSPFAFPFQGWKVGDWINQRIVRAQVGRAYRILGLQQTIIWSYVPHFLDAGRNVPALATLYYRTDDYSAMPGVDVRSLHAWEMKAVSSADICVGAFERFLNGVFTTARRRLYVPNAVDLSHYETNTASRRLDDVGRPRLLMMGTMESWLDRDLLKALMRENQEWNLVLAGDIKVFISDLLSLKNVHYVGVLDYEELPSLVRDCDIGLVPFQMSDVTSGASPGKLYQYLGAGLPVVVTPFMNVDGFEGHVEAAIAQAGPFAEAITRLMSLDSPALRRQRRQLASLNSWGARFDLIEATIAEVLAARTRTPAESASGTSEQVGADLL